MKQVMQLFLHFFSWYPGSQWVMRLGIGFAIVAIVLALILGNATLAWIWLKMAYVVLAFHFLSLPGYLRNLLSNHRLGLIPRFYQKTGIAMLLFTVFVSVFLQATTLLLGLDTLAPGTALFFFTVASMYMGYVQFAVTRRHAINYMVFFVLCFSILFTASVGKFGAEWIINFIPLFTASSFICLGGWLWAIDFLSKHDQFKPANTVFNTHFTPENSKESFNNLWKNRDKDPAGTTTSGTLMIGMPDGLRNFFQGSFIWLMVFPISMVVIVTVFGAFTREDAFPPVLWVFLISSAVIGGWSTIGFGEYAARSRLLWLRLGSDRTSLWRHLELTSIKFITMFFTTSLFVAAAFYVFFQFDSVFIINYLLFIPVMNLFLLYLAILVRILNWHGVFKASAVIAFVFILIFIGGNAVNTLDFTALNLLEAGMVVGALILRYFARRSFLGIDWFQVQPFSLARLYGK